MEGKGFVKLRITGQDLDLEQIKKELLHQPSFVYRKGDCYTPKFGDKKPVVYKEDCWILEGEKQDVETIDGMLYRFLTELEESKKYLKEISDNADVALWVSVYPNSEQSNIHIENNTLKLLADMGLVIDFDIMFLKEFYDATYNQ